MKKIKDLLKENIEITELLNAEQTVLPEITKSLVAKMLTNNKEALSNEPELIGVAGFILNIKEITRIDPINANIGSYSFSIWNGSEFIACLRFETMEELQDKRSKIISMLHVKIL